jgi:hypothetical protein
MNKKQLNSMLYDLYVLMLTHGTNFDELQNIKRNFDVFYKLIDEEKIEESKAILRELTEYLGEDNSEVFRANLILENE